MDISKTLDDKLDGGSELPHKANKNVKTSISRNDLKVILGVPVLDMPRVPLNKNKNQENHDEDK